MLFISKKTSVAFFCVALIFLFLNACKKGGNGTTPVNTESGPKITLLSVAQGSYNTQVTITGIGFSPNSSEDKVTFNNKAATILSASSTSLTVLVPLGAGTGNVAVNVTGVNAIGPSFEYIITDVVTTFAGEGSAGAKDGDATHANFLEPVGMAVDATGNIYVADAQNNKIRMITADGTVSTFAGTGTAGAANGTRLNATFNNPRGLAFDPSGNLYVADSFNQLIRKIAPDGQVTTFAGDGFTHSNNGTGTGASFFNPSDVATDGDGNIYVADFQNALIRKITPSGVVTTLAGSGTIGADNGTGTHASFGQPESIDYDNAGNLYVVERINNMVRKISLAGVVTTVAGGHEGLVNGAGTAAGFKGPQGLTVDKDGNIYIADTGDRVIRKINTTNEVTTFAGTDGALPADGPVAKAGFLAPVSVLAYNGVIYISDALRRKILKVSKQ